MANAFEGLSTLRHQVVFGHQPTESKAVVHETCPHCGGRQMLVLAAEVDGSGGFLDDATRWLRCVACNRGAVMESGRVSPPAAPLRVPAGLPEADLAIWNEARTCLGVGAHVAAVMLCRKLLFHIAVANDLAPKNEKGWAPSYAAAAEHLEKVGVFTAKMRPWVDRIKDVGNDANHEVTPVSAEQALDVAAFTEQLLILAYELDALMEKPGLAVAPEAE